MDTLSEPCRPPMTSPDNLRPLEDAITTDLRERLTYGGYLQLDTLLAAHPSWLAVGRERG